MSRHYAGHQEMYHDPRHHVHHPPVMQNTSSAALIQTHGTGNAPSNGPSSSFQTPAIAGEAVSSSRPVGGLSSAPPFSIQHTLPAGALRSSSLGTGLMGHGQSKATPPLTQSSLPPQSLTSGVNPALDAGSPKGLNVTGKKLKRPFGAKTKESGSSYSPTSKATTGETISVAKSTSHLLPSECAPDSTRSLKSPQQSFIMSTAPPFPPSQIIDKRLVTSSSNPPPSLQLSASSSGQLEPPPEESSAIVSSSGVLPKSSPSTLDPPVAAGNRSSVIALSPGISSAINFMMMEWQEPSKPQLTVDTSSTAVSVPPSLPSGDGGSPKTNKDSVRRHSSGSAPTSPDKREMKESWRKSDSTNSHHTVRANSLRASRPVSWAESFHSAYTIVPANGATVSQGLSSRRLSGLISDVDFGVREEELEEDVDANAEDSLSSSSHHFAASNSIQDSSVDDNLCPPVAELAPPPVPHKSKDLLKKANRRSISLSSTMPGPVAGLFSVAKPLQPEAFVATTMPAPAFPSSPEGRKASYSISGMDSFRNVSLPHVHKHFRQQSESLLYQRPPVPLHSDMTHPPSMVSSTSQVDSGCRPTQDKILPQQPSATSDLKGNRHAFLPPLSRNEQGISSVPSDSSHSSANAFAQMQTLPPATPVSTSSHLRHPTISSLGPSAAGMARRAVERMSRRLGDIMIGFSSSSNSSSSVSGHSSSTSISTSASTSVTSGTSLVPSPLTDANRQQSQAQTAGYVPGKTASRGPNPAIPVAPQGSGHAHHHSMIHVFLPGPSRSGGHKRLQKSLGSAAAMADVVTSGGSSSALSSTSASTSESDPFSPTGPMLGRRLRYPSKKRNVFGSELKTAVKETKVVVQENDAVDAVEGSPSRKDGLILALECRVLPAVVVRCAQHLLIWGVQEEGLFRVNGHPRHVNHLRAEFDSGADYDMTECSPSELDPHAVASVFKAYLRELPDSILTYKLQPYFDAAINKENTLHVYEQQPSTQTRQGLPSNPRNSAALPSLHRPPSLSTLAMPSFKQAPPSKSLVHALRSLISKLPPENRDLIRTVVDLIKATSNGSKATKMPLSNLLLLFCPSLNMSPPLLRILCETDGIWEEEPTGCKSGDRAQDVIVESDGEPVVVSPRQKTYAFQDGIEADTKSGFDEASSLRSERASLDKPGSLDYHASAEEDSLFQEERPVLRSRKIADRPEIPTVYLDTRSHLSSSSASLLQGVPETNRHAGSFLVHQEMRDDGSISSGAYSFKIDNLPTSPSPPPLSSSVSTPTSSTNASFSNLPLDGGKEPEQQKRSDADLPSAVSRTSPQIVGSELGEIRKRPYISNPIPISGPLPAQYPFPTTRNREHAPVTPSRRRSIPLLSLSGLSSRSCGSPSASPSSKNSPYQADSRMSKPSLKLLFSKKSTSSLFDGKERPVISLPLLQPPEPHFQQERSSSRSGSDSSISTPHSAVTAPQGSSLLCLPDSSNEGPPVLNTPIEESSLKFHEVMHCDEDSARGRLDRPSSRPKGLSRPPYVSPMTISASRSVSGGRPKSPSDIPPLPSSQLPVSQPRDEDWMRSVLMAADAALPAGSKLL